jgi:small conductance mechanosensitive channel
MTEVDTDALTTSVEAGVQNITQNGWEGALKIILLAVILLVVCLIVKRILLKILDKGLDRSHVDKTFHTFIRSAANVLLWFVVIMIVAQSVGINATSLITLLGIVGLAISLSVQDSLSNLAGGITILTTRPFKVGDYVEIGDTAGTILEIGMVHTKLNSLDNRRIVVPNSTVVSAKVTNYSTEDRRRVDLVVSAAYQAPVELVKETIQEVCRSHEKVLADPEPFVRLSAYGASAIEYTVRAWCLNEDYWDVYFDLLEGVKTAFDAKQISIPYPQVEITMKK